MRLLRNTQTESQIPKISSCRWFLLPQTCILPVNLSKVQGELTRQIYFATVSIYNGPQIAKPVIGALSKKNPQVTGFCLPNFWRAAIDGRNICRLVWPSSQQNLHPPIVQTSWCRLASSTANWQWKCSTKLLQFSNLGVQAWKQVSAIELALESTLCSTSSRPRTSISFILARRFAEIQNSFHLCLYLFRHLQH